MQKFTVRLDIFGNPNIFTDDLLAQEEYEKTYPGRTIGKGLSYDEAATICRLWSSGNLVKSWTGAAGVRSRGTDE